MNTNTRLRLKLAAVALASGAAIIGLAACQRANVRPSETEAAYRICFGGGAGCSYVNVWTDPETGCQSYMTDDGFLSPRLTPNGQQRCRLPSGTPIFGDQAPAPATNAAPQ